MYTDVRKLFEDLPSAVATALSQVRGRRGGGRASHGGGRREGEGARVQAGWRCKLLVACCCRLPCPRDVHTMPTPACCRYLQAQQQQLTSLALENLELRLESKLASKDEVKEVKDELNRNFSVLGVVVSLFAYFAMFK